MKRLLVVSGVVVGLFGAVALANPVETPARNAEADHAAACGAMMGGEGATAEGRAEMDRFMESGAMERTMTGMVELEAQFGDAFRRYRATVPAFLPRIRSANRTSTPRVDGLTASEQPVTPHR